ncbi:MAG: lactonase family protein, partial [Planctomycetota bacterium]
VIAYREYKNALSPSSIQDIGGGAACHLSTDANARLLITSQYGGGNVAVFPLDSKGEIEPRSQLIELEGGSNVVKGRQRSPHPHYIGFSPDDRFVLVPDLGTDQVRIYEVDYENKKLSSHSVGRMPPGSGPRHMKFSPDGQSVWVLGELDLTVNVFDWDPEGGTMELVQSVATVDADDLAKERFKSASEIRVHPNGKFVYSANRGHDTISVFEVVDQNNLKRVQIMPVRGSIPRNFSLTPDGEWLLVGGQKSHTLAVFEIDADSGELTFHQEVITTPAPICVLMP